MDWSWLDSGATALLGVAGIFFTWLTGKQARDNARDLFQRQSEHASREARLARSHDRRSDAYVHALEVAEQVGNWCQSVQPMVVTDPPQPLPDLPELGTQVAARARLLAFGSDEVRHLWTGWEDSARTILADDRYLADMRAESRAEEGPYLMDVHRELTLEHKPTEARNRKALADQINLELGA